MENVQPVGNHLQISAVQGKFAMRAVIYPEGLGEERPSGFKCGFAALILHWAAPKTRRSSLGECQVMELSGYTGLAWKTSRMSRE